MNFIVKCPGCGHNVLARSGAEYTSEIITTESKTCPACKKSLRVEIKIKATLIEEKKAEPSTP